MSFFAVFLAVFLAELGDKTQIASAAFAAGDPGRAVKIFLAASLALTASTAIAVFFGQLAGAHLERLPLKLISGLIFITLGMLAVIDHFRSAAP
ncbi:MAG: TMEM165/GDT1 family protein [Oceanicaulis sp.]